MDRAIFILGPTCSGKSEMAIRLAKDYRGEIISADSVQIFKGFDIGSAKITQSQMQGVKHHGIDICQPNQEFSVYDFVQFTRAKIAEICARGHLPIVVGGTGLYIKALLCGYNFGDADKHEEFRAELENFARENGNLRLWQRLESLDAQSAAQIPPNNVKRVIRAIEVCTFGTQKASRAVDFKAKAFALTMDREILYQKINSRVDKMLASGLIDEVKGLLQQGTSPTSQPMQAIGYKEVVKFLDGTLTFDEMTEQIKQHTRNYAKRQMTFIRGMTDVQIIDALDDEAFEKLSQMTKKFVEEI